MTHNGWRNPTPGLLQAEKFAQAGEQLAIPKNRATKAIKKVAACIGLKMPDIVLLDTLCAFTQEQDWEEGQRPIVWPSNAYLEERTGMTIRCIQRHVRRLCEVGVISMKDKKEMKMDIFKLLMVLILHRSRLAPMSLKLWKLVTLKSESL